MTFTRTRLVAVNEMGLRIGEDHPRAKLTDAQVDEIRELHEEQGIIPRVLAERFNVSRSCIRQILSYEKRAQTPAGWRRVPVS